MVHAVKSIAQDEEITVCYLKELEFIFWSRERRLHELESIWNFRCQCSTCNQQPVYPADAPDDPSREALRVLHEDTKLIIPPNPRQRRTISGDTHNTIEEEREHVQYCTDITKLTQFANGLDALGVTDERLGDA